MSVLEQKESLLEKISRIKNSRGIQFLDDQACIWLWNEMIGERDWWLALSDDQIAQLNEIWPSNSGLTTEYKPDRSVAEFLQKAGVKGTFSDGLQQIVSWSGFREKVTLELGRKALREARQTAEEEDPDLLVIDEINAEIAAYRAERRAKEILDAKLSAV